MKLTQVRINLCAEASLLKDGKLLISIHSSEIKLGVQVNSLFKYHKSFL